MQKVVLVKHGSTPSRDQISLTHSVVGYTVVHSQLSGAPLVIQLSKEPPEQVHQQHACMILLHGLCDSHICVLMHILMQNFLELYNHLAGTPPLFTCHCVHQHPALFYPLFTSIFFFILYLLSDQQ